MTISLKCFEHKTKSQETVGFWNTDGTILVFQGADWDARDRWVPRVSMTPQILKEIILAAKGGEGAFYDTGVIDFPGMLPSRKRIVAKREGTKIAITEHDDTFDFSPNPPISLHQSQLKAILNNALDIMGDFDKKIGIRPILGDILRNDKTKKV